MYFQYISTLFALLSASLMLYKNINKRDVKVPDVDKLSEEYIATEINGIEKYTLVGIYQHLDNGIAYVCMCGGRHKVSSMHDGLIISMQIYLWKHNILMLFKLFYTHVGGDRYIKCKLCEYDVYIHPTEYPMSEEMDHIYKYHSVNGDCDVVLSVRNDEGRIGIMKIKDKYGFRLDGSINCNASNRKNIYYCYFSNKFLHHEMFLERFLFIKHVQSKEIIERIYEDASIWTESRDIDNYREHITTNMTFACILCGCIYDCFPTEYAFLRHISKCTNDDAE